jgi:hypothetical protein
VKETGTDVAPNRRLQAKGGFVTDVVLWADAKSKQRDVDEAREVKFKAESAGVAESKQKGVMGPTRSQSPHTETDAKSKSHRLTRSQSLTSGGRRR